VVAFSADVWPRRFDQYARFYLMPRLPIPALRYLTLFALMPPLALWLALIWRADVLITQSPYEGAVAGWVKAIARLFGRQVVVIVENHGDFEESVFMQRRVRFEGLYRGLMRALARAAFRRADLLRAISSMTQDQLAAWAPDKPIVRFMTWTDAGAFLDAPREVPLAQSCDVVYAGALIPRKGVEVLIAAFGHIAADFPESRLWIVGAPENAGYAAQLERQAADLGLADCITFAGALPQAELARVMARGRVLAVPSISEGLGRVVVEAMMCGTPVVGSRVGGIPDMIEDGATGYLVPPQNADALADALRRVLSDPHVERMGRAARAFAEGFFSPAGYVDGYRRLLQQAAALIDGQVAHA
jgi:glycosyltransferase involved in cell wall biosynthesis